jgi:hypothetical protein
MCDECEALFEDTELFCPRCGAVLVQQRTRTQLQSIASRDAEKSSRWRNRLLLLGIVGGIVFSVIGWLTTELMGMDSSPWICGWIGPPLTFGFLGGLLGVVIDVWRKRSARQ